MSKREWIVAIGVVASVITILKFIGSPDLPDFFKRFSSSTTERTNPTPSQPPRKVGLGSRCLQNLVWEI